MSFRDNLQHLRATRNMTQEHLAMLLGVSRQSVSKWEAERAYPEMDKLIKICSIFDCTLDELVSGDLTDRALEPAASMAAGIKQDVTDYDANARRFALTLPTGIAIIIAGLGFTCFADGPGLTVRASDALAIVPLFLCIAVGIALIIISASKWSAFTRAHPFIEDFYTEDDRSRASSRRAIMISIGIAAILAGIVITALLADRVADYLAGASFFFPVAIGVWLIVHGSMMGGRVNIEAYNEDQLADLSDSQLDELDEARRERALHARKMRAWYGAIMIVATIVALLWLFFVQAEYTKGFFWIPWMVGGLVCAIVACVDKARK